MQSQAMRRLVANLTANSGTRNEKGELGERRAREWFDRHKIEYYAIPQGKNEMPMSLAQMGGKRPDFMISFGEGEPVVYMDAKFHNTSNVTEFVLEQSELDKYVAFRAWIKEEYGDDGDRQVFFILYPHELSGEQFLLIDLEEMLTAERVTREDKPARKLRISKDEGPWFK
jgi:hypothetical protein